ncbi:MAG: T9SS type A sorting domain-containing protein [Candidatus Marinimicrobia bacterium]|nr:T9SS type A sorting domain-containing protein [Candidatus Neomarinimicrobiota bacterium]
MVDNSVLPETYAISANYPNPFNPTTEINYQVPENANVKIVIFNLLGQKVATLVDDELVAGFHSTQFNGLTDRGRPLSSGIYFYRMTTGGFSKTQKMMFLK